MATNLTEHFTLEEMIASNTATAKHIDNTPTPEIVEHLRQLCVEILEPLREAWGKPIKVSSGYRCEKLNKAVNGSSTSAHTTGYAADIVPANGKIHEFKSFVIKWFKNTNIKFDQCINEFTKTSQWIHIGLYNRKGQQRKEFLKYQNGTYSKLQ